MGALVVFRKLPKKAQQLIVRYHLLTDVLTLIGIYYLLGGTLTALFAAAMCGIAVSLLLYVANNKNDFLYLYDIKEAIKLRITQAQQALNDYGHKYREQLEANDG